jgi:purine-nucleoside phosphorylase
VKELVEKQALAVDMEMSALFSVADYYARPLGGLIFISDVVSTEGAWELGLCGERLDNLYHRLTDIVLEFVR